MIAYIFAILSSVTAAGNDVFSKKIIVQNKYAKTYLITLRAFIFISIFLIIAYLLKLAQIKPIPLVFILMILGNTIISTLGQVSIYNGMRKSPASVCQPFLALTPLSVLFLELISYKFGFLSSIDLPNIASVFGILIIVTSVILVSIRSFKHLTLEELSGVKEFALGAVIFWGTSTFFDRQLVREVGVPIYSFLVLLFRIVVLKSILTVTSNKQPISIHSRTPSAGAAYAWYCGILQFLENISTNIANLFLPASIVNSVKRTRIVFATLFDAKLHKTHLAKADIFLAVLSALGVFIMLYFK